MKRIVAAAILIFCFVLAAWAAEQAAFVGTWVYDAEKSEPLHAVMAGMGGMGGMGGGMGGMGGGMGGGMPRGGGGMPGGGMGGGMGRGPGRGGMGGPGAQNPRTVPMTVEQNGNEIKITRVTNGVPSVQIINADGVEREEMVAEPNRKDKVKVTTKATLKKNKIVVEKVTHYPEYKVKYKGEFEVSDEGKVLTIKTVNSNNKTQFEEKQVYNRQVSQQ